jgi:hypothetical protein
MNPMMMYLDVAIVGFVGVMIPLLDMKKAICQ